MGERIFTDTFNDKLCVAYVEYMPDLIAVYTGEDNSTDAWHFTKAEAIKMAAALLELATKD